VFLTLTGHVAEDDQVVRATTGGGEAA
jgi:hypothetical protein